jgi:sulfide:quinone oxidoreductase
MSENGKTILVLGGGVGGLAAANDLRRSLGREHKIIIVDKNSEHVSYSSALWLLIGMRELSEIKKDLSRLILDDIEFINEDIRSIDTADRSVKTATKKLSYDYLIVALGVSLAPENIPGLADSFGDNAFNLYDLGDIIKAKDALNKFTKGDLIVMVSSLPYKCPVAPNEGSMLLNYFFTKKGVREKINIKLCTPEMLPLGGNGPTTGKAVKGMMESYGIEYKAQHNLESVDSGKREIVFDKGTVPYDLLLAIPPHKAPKVLDDAGLTDGGWIPVDKGSLQTGTDNVYAIGDNAKIKLPGEWKEGVPLMLSKGGVFAHFEAKVVAENIANEINGKSERVEYTGRGACFVETGFGKAALAEGNFFTEAHPDTVLKGPSKSLHLAKVMFEKFWLSESFLKRPVDILMERTAYGNYKKTVSK